jgi:hypothetical protein
MRALMQAYSESCTANTTGRATHRFFGCRSLDRNQGGGPLQCENPSAEGESEAVRQVQRSCLPLFTTALRWKGQA